ncbi:MAG: serine protease [Deltaproteobacteria bacterium]|nr:MAG: serine protease [Deltaproteobacteria bacterium]
MKKWMIALPLFIFYLGCSQKEAATGSYILPETVLKNFQSLDYCQVQGQRLQKAIYGKDGRMNPCQFTDGGKMLGLSSNVAMLVNTSQVEKVGAFENQTLYKINSQTYGEFFESQMKEPLCDSVTFKNEPAPAFCSAFLINTNGKKSILTAGHCIKGRKLEDIKIVFSVHKEGMSFIPEDSKLEKEMVVSESQIFKVTNIKTDTSLNNLDIALLELDREVEAEGFAVNETGDLIREGQDMILIGHPVGLEIKLDLGGEIKSVNKESPTNRKHYFEASVDAFSGNSGSPLLDLQTQEVVGILISGNGDFKKDWFKGCYEEKKYSEYYSSEYERALRIDSALELFSL